MQHPTVFAHRGLNRKAPENTMAAFAAAQTAGVPWLETDTDILADGTPILIHDSTTDRTTDRAGSIYELTRTDLPEISAGAWFSPEFAHQRIPTLAELIDFLIAHPMNLNLELKGNEQGKATSLALVEAVLTELERLPHAIEVMICSFSPLLLAAVHQRNESIPLALLTARGLLGRDWRSILELSGASLIHPEADMLTPDLVHDFRDAGYAVNAWTVNNPQRANELLNWGCTGIITDIADDLLRLLPRQEGKR